jgi:hypothetical protein
MDRFRANIANSLMMNMPLKPYSEDKYHVVGIFPASPFTPQTSGSSSDINGSSVGGPVILMDVPYPPCARCKVPTCDTEAATMHPQNQPTKVMQQIRSGTALGLTEPKLAKHTFFGIHMTSPSLTQTKPVGADASASANAGAEEEEEAEEVTEEMHVSVGDKVWGMDCHMNKAFLEKCFAQGAMWYEYGK